MNPHMREAISEAHTGVKNGDGGPFGAVVVQNGRVIARGHNTVVRDHDPTCHAEINAIREASKVLGRFDLSDCELYTSCEPCPMCYAATYWARIKTIYRGATKKDASSIGFDDEAIYTDLARPPAAREIPVVELDREAALEPFRAWAEKDDRVPY